MTETPQAWNPAILDAYPFNATPPSDLQAETRIIGAILTGDLALAEAVATLDPEHFADPIHGAIFRAIGDGPEPGRSLDELLAHFERTGSLDEVGGPAYLVQIVAEARARSPELPGSMEDSIWRAADTDMKAVRDTWEARCESIRCGVG